MASCLYKQEPGDMSSRISIVPGSWKEAIVSDLSRVLGSFLPWATIRDVWNNTKITWHMVIQAVESLLQIGLAGPLSPSAWIKGLSHFQNPCIDLIQTMCIPIDTQLSPPDSASFPVGVIPTPSKLHMAWSLLYPSGGVEKCYQNWYYDPLSSPHCCLWQGAAMGHIPENLPGICQA